MTPSKGIWTQNLKKAYASKTAVAGVDIHVQPGEIVGLLGPNGAGKTTSFYMIVGLVSPSSGHVYLDDHDITKLPMYQRARLGIGYLPQEPSVFRKLSVFDNIYAIVETLNLPKSEFKPRTEALLNELSLLHLANQKAYTLSGGERRRLEITRALVNNPRFILMDEPFSGVDPISVQQVQEIILALKKRGIGILITDHNVRETLSIVDRGYLLYNGQILAHGTSNDLINDPSSRKLSLGESFNL